MSEDKIKTMRLIFPQLESIKEYFKNFFFRNSKQAMQWLMLAHVCACARRDAIQHSVFRVHLILECSLQIVCFRRTFIRIFPAIHHSLSYRTIYTYVMAPADFAHPWIRFYITFKIYVSSFAYWRCIQISSKLQANDGCICKCDLARMKHWDIIPSNEFEYFI